jgi:orotate phosphoribosyltransferase
MLKETGGAEGTIDLMKQSGALLEGHFVLSSGLHSDKYVQCARLLEVPSRAEQVGRSLARLVEKALGRGTIEAVANPALGGVIIGHEVARALGVRCIFVERAGGRMALRRGFELREGEKVLVVEDVVTTGLSTKEVGSVVSECGAEVVGIASIVNRSAGVDFGVPFAYLVRAEITNHDPGGCPLCKAGVPLVKPGSRNLGKHNP